MEKKNRKARPAIVFDPFAVLIVGVIFIVLFFILYMADVNLNTEKYIADWGGGTGGSENVTTTLGTSENTDTISGI